MLPDLLIMKGLKNIILLLPILVFYTGCQNNRHNIFVEAESFEDEGGWVIDQQFMNEMGSPYLLAHGLGVPVKDASCEVRFKKSDNYNVWVRTRDWVGPWKTPDVEADKKAEGYPGVFQVLIDGVALETTFGTEKPDWHWQYGGNRRISRGLHFLALHDLTGFEGRCDALCFSSDNSYVPPDEMKELLQLRLKTKALSRVRNSGKFDLVVIGGGIAGICSSVSASRFGLKVALIQNRPVLGGNNSSEVRVWLEGKTSFEPYPEIGNIVKELDQKNRGAYGSENKGDNYEDWKKNQVIKNENNITLFLNFEANEVIKDGDLIKYVIAQNIKTGQRIKVEGKLFSDCTGHGTIGYIAGADYEMTTEGHMGSTNQFNFTETDTVQPFPRCPWALDLSDKQFPGRGNIPGIYVGTGLPALGGWYWESGFYHDPIQKGEYIRDWNFRAAYGAWDCLKNVDSLYQNYRFNWMAFISGNRESRRLVGDVLLSYDDIKTAKQFEDGCVPTSWSLDLHLPHPDYYKGFEGDGFISLDHHDLYKRPYWIPYRCLYSRNISNLFMAGRNISVTHEALGVVRVQRTTGMMGEIVGMAAAICIDKGCLPKEVHTKYLADLKNMMKAGVPKIIYKDLSEDNSN